MIALAGSERIDGYQVRKRSLSKAFARFFERVVTEISHSSSTLL
jgi:hypothetical protein